MKLIDNASIFKEVKDSDELINISIGDIDEHPDVSIVRAKVRIGKGENSSSIALIGPTRMDYDKALSALEYLAKALDEYFEVNKKGDN